MALATTAAYTLKIVVAEHDGTLHRLLRESLESSAGHRVVGEATTGTDMVRLVLDLEPDVVLFDLHLPRLDGLDALRQIHQERGVAAVAIASERDQGLVRRALDEFALAYLVRPVLAHQIEPAVLVAWNEFNRIRQLADENATLRQSLQNRKLVERAKGVLMKRHRWSEAEAYRRLQRGAMNRRTTMAELAQTVLNGANVELGDGSDERPLRIIGGHRSG